MRIIFLIENFYCGGLDSFLINLANHWPHLEDELIIICNQGHPGYSVIESGLTRPYKVVRHNISMYADLVIKTRRNIFLRGVRQILSPALKLGYIVHYVLRLKAIFSRWQADRLMVVNGGHPGGDTCRAAVIAWKMCAAGKPNAIYNFHNLADLPRWFEKWIEKLLDIMVIRCVRAFIGVSRVCAESMRVRIGDQVMKKMSWIHNGVTEPGSPRVSSFTLRQELGIPAISPLCLMLGTYEQRKGHDFLFQAFRKVIIEIPDVYLVVCGYGYPEEIARVEKLVETYGLSHHVRLQGFRADVDVMLKQSDLLLVASQAYESFGLTSVEAMANRVPMVATRVGGIPEVVKDGDGGFCIDPDDIDGYAEIILKFLKDATFREEQAEKGYQRYRRLFSAERMAKQYAQVIRQD